VRLDSTGGAIDATIIVVSRGGEHFTKRSTVCIATQSGSITAKLVSVMLFYFHIPYDHRGLESRPGFGEACDSDGRPEQNRKCDCLLAPIVSWIS
jgi:hypothetical protein